jgi:hypothetical protein
VYDRSKSKSFYFPVAPQNTKFECESVDWKNMFSLFINIQNEVSYFEISIAGGKQLVFHSRTVYYCIIAGVSRSQQPD